MSPTLVSHLKNPTKNPTPPIIGAGINFWFGEDELKKQILFDVNVQIDPGEILLLTGPSGSGKTTLLTLIGALRTLRSGSLKVFNNELLDATTQQQVEVRRRIGFIFQAHNLLGHLTACENVQLMLEHKKEMTPEVGRRRAEEVLEAVGLKDRIDYLPAKLSGGQRQRVAVARALVGNPELVLADEPTSALDSKSGREVVEILAKLAKDKGCPILMVTHDSRVLDLADRIIHMEDGRIKENTSDTGKIPN
jgi:putative ABC transport system ATP-binding protein